MLFLSPICTLELRPTLLQLSHINLLQQYLIIPSRCLSAVIDVWIGVVKNVGVAVELRWVSSSRSTIATSTTLSIDRHRPPHQCFSLMSTVLTSTPSLNHLSSSPIRTSFPLIIRLRICPFSANVQSSSP